MRSLADLYELETSVGQAVLDDKPPTPPEEPTSSEEPAKDSGQARLTPRRRDSLGGVPQRLGACSLQKPIGTGGTGTVFLATLVEDRPYAKAGAQVAVKVLHPDRLESVTVLRRFLREAELGRSLNHPGVVRTYDIGRQETDEGNVLHYLVLEYVEGRTLRDLMKQFSVLPEALLQDLALQIADGLASVHAAGAAHRDLKPGNILITPDYQVKLMDLGVAFLLENNTRLTRTGYFVGTILYAAPEQVRGETVGPAADLYSLGVLLYEAATGVQPFEASTASATIQRQLRHVPPKAGHLNPNLTPWMEEVIACLMDKDPQGRFSSTAELMEALDEGESSHWWAQRQKILQDAQPRSRSRRISVSRDTTFVGRFGEIQTLKALFRDVRQGRGRVALVEGEAGVGKTRLLDQLIHQLEAEGEGFRLLYGSNAPGRVGGTSGALTQAVLSLFGKAQLEEQLRRYLVATPRLVPGFTALLTGAPPPPGAEPLSSDTIHALFVYLASVLAVEEPVVWVVEDLHFASAESRTLFLSLARETAEQKILLVGTSRPGLPNDELADLERLDHFRRLGLGRLSGRQVIRLLRDILSSEPAAESLGRRLALQSDGNPFFIVEMVRELKERKLLRRANDSDTYTLTGELTRAIVPASVRELLLSRLSPVGREDRALLDLGAVQGFSFDADLLARVREMKKLHVLDSLAEIERRSGVIRATGAGFRFDHHQMQEVLYAALPQVVRVEYHAALAEAYEKREGLAEKTPEQMRGEEAVFLAVHYLKGRKRRQGTRTLLAALDYLGSSYHHEALLELADLALTALGDQDPALRCDIRRRQADCFDLLGQRDDQRKAVEDALASAAATGDEMRLAWAELAHGRLKVAMEDYRGAREILEETLAHEACSRDKHLQASARGLMGSALINLGEPDLAEKEWKRQLELANDLRSPRLQVVAGFYVGSVLVVQGQYEEANCQFEETLKICKEINQLQAQARIYAFLGLSYRYQGQYPRARKVLLKSLKISGEIGFREGEILGLGNLAELSLDEGRPGEAAEYLEKYLQRSRALQRRHFEGYALLCSGDLARSRGDLEEALRWYHEALALHQSLGVQRAVAQTTLSLGRLLLEMGKPEEARPLLLEASDLTLEYFLDVPGPLPQAYLALLGEIPAQEVTFLRQTPVFLHCEARWVLYRATADEQHLEKAALLLGQMCAHLSGPEQEDFLRFHPVACQMRESLGESGWLPAVSGPSSTSVTRTTTEFPVRSEIVRTSQSSGVEADRPGEPPRSEGDLL